MLGIRCADGRRLLQTPDPGAPVSALKARGGMRSGGKRVVILKLQLFLRRRVRSPRGPHFFRGDIAAAVRRRGSRMSALLSEGLQSDVDGAQSASSCLLPASHGRQAVHVEKRAPSACPCFLWGCRQTRPTQIDPAANAGAAAAAHDGASGRFWRPW